MLKSSYPFLIFLFASLGLFAADPGILQAKLVASYYAQKMDIPEKDIEVVIVHSPTMDHELLKRGVVEVQSGRRLNLGQQTLWLVHKVDHIIKKRWAITVNVSAHLLLPTARSNISRLDILDESNISYETHRVGREFDRLVKADDPIIGKMATQGIREGRLIERNMFKTAPDVLLGDDLKIILLNKGIALALPGIAREEALVGEEIRVQCPTTRKEFTGILQNPNEVLVSIR